MLSVAPASTKELLCCLQTCPHQRKRGLVREGVTRGCGAGRGGDSNNFVCTWDEFLPTLSVTAGNKPELLSDSPDKRRSKGTPWLGREMQHKSLGGGTHVQPWLGCWVQAQHSALSMCQTNPAALIRHQPRLEVGQDTRD